MRKLASEDWIKKAEQKYGDICDYSQTEYINAKTNLKIRCKLHDYVFCVLPYNHMRNGGGCPYCRRDKIRNALAMSREEFIDKAKNIQGDVYDYSEVNYINNRTSVCIICHKKDQNGEEHGAFMQTPDDHLQGKGCPYCAGNKKRTLESFIIDANNRHNNFYTYEHAEYKGIHVPLLITCPIHGDFWMAPNEHLRGQSCPHCKQSKSEKIIYAFLKENHIDFIPQYRYDKQRRKYALDFYLPSYSVGIECQGIQHFQPTDFANRGEEWAIAEYEKNKMRDQLKYDVCTQNGIEVVYFIDEKLMDKACNDIFYQSKNIIAQVNEINKYIIV